MRRILLAVFTAILSCVFGSVKAEVTFVQPIAGAVLTAGADYTIKWTTTDSVPDSAFLNFIYEDGGFAMVNEIGYVTLAKGEYVYTLPEEPSPGELYYFSFSGLSTSGKFSIKKRATSIDNVEQNASVLELYPNPSSGSINIETPGIIGIEVVDLTGKVRYQHNPSSITGAHTLSLSERGIYLVRVHTASAVLTRKVTIQ